MNTEQWIAFGAVILQILALAGFAAMIWRREKRIERDRRDAVDNRSIDHLIDEVLSSQQAADDWLDAKKAIIAEVFDKGEAWVDVFGHVVDKDDPQAVAVYTFSAIRAAMMKFYTEGMKNKER